MPIYYPIANKAPTLKNHFYLLSKTGGEMFGAFLFIKYPRNFMVKLNLFLPRCGRVGDF